MDCFRLLPITEKVTFRVWMQVINFVEDGE